DPQLLAVAVAMIALSYLPLHGELDPQWAKATGTDARKHVPEHVPTCGKQSISEATAGTAGRIGGGQGAMVSGANDRVRATLSTGDKMEPMGIEPTTSALRTQGRGDASVANKEVVNTAAPACTNACTDSPESMHATPTSDTAAIFAEAVAAV